jgi:hypothetical protein
MTGTGGTPGVAGIHRGGAGAFGTYVWDDAAGLYVPGGLDVLTIRGGQVAEVTVFLNADLTRFRLPAHLRAGARP